jgi:hypothetical protein
MNDKLSKENLNLLFTNIPNKYNKGKLFTGNFNKKEFSTIPQSYHESLNG